MHSAHFINDNIKAQDFLIFYYKIQWLTDESDLKPTVVTPLGYFLPQ